ncbi:MAG: DUF2148 domain-containing protein [Mucinivorans sp.]
MVEQENTLRPSSLLAVARSMMSAARTAPKACGVDSLEIAVVTGDDIKLLADKMREIGPKLGKDFFVRDAGNIVQAEAIVLLGMRNQTLGLNCALCGYATCAMKPATNPCFFKAQDLGIAIGSAASVAADNRVDSRVMYSVGVAAMELNFLPLCHAVMAIPISATGKSPFFDRK